ncbi:M23 family metallopeptidase [Moritella yayanosii]|uniref:Putative peptidase, M23/M37 family n=1 Tax=Moritella yayanosii TaxID=69539 RepID=A0A330LSM7_9GAMM|nr:M23 family metallopeptidase [Moritella yayanosii]SQD79743.1 putative peptidase, M23/M37 family [Moritella yayanosii]
MSVTVTYSNGKHTYFKLCNIYWLIAAFIAVIAVSIAFSGFIYSNYSSQAIQLKIAKAQQKHQQQADRILSLRQETNLKIAVFASRVGMLQAEVNRLSLLSDELAKNANLTRGEFDFTGAAIGGPIDTDSSYAVDLQTLLEEMDLLSLEINNRSQQLSLLETMLLNHNITDEAVLSGRPVIQRGSWLSSPYGVRKDPFTGQATMHKGIDFAGNNGMNIIATGAGVVTWSGRRSGYGLLIEINHGNGLSSRYAHAKELIAKEGDVVGKGQTIAIMGSSGRSTGPHVHYEVLKSGRQVDPKRYVYR